MARQYVTASFSENNARTYTYHNDGPPVAIGDEVHVDIKGRKKRVRITGILEEAPTKFETKPILGLAPPKDEKTETEEHAG